LFVARAALLSRQKAVMAPGAAIRGEAELFQDQFQAMAATAVTVITVAFRAFYSVAIVGNFTHISLSI